MNHKARQGFGPDVPLNHACYAPAFYTGQRDMTQLLKLERHGGFKPRRNLGIGYPKPNSRSQVPNWFVQTSGLNLNLTLSPNTVMNKCYTPFIHSSEPLKPARSRPICLPCVIDRQLSLG